MDEKNREKDDTKVNEMIKHYDKLIDDGNDPVYDSKALREHMERWDGQAFIDELQLAADKRILEIGVGTGRLAVKTAPLCGTYDGIDLSTKTILRAKQNLSEFHNVSLYCADFMSYAFPIQYDIIYSSLTFMHIREKQKAIDKIAGLLQNKGRFVLSIDKNHSGYIDMSSYQLKIYPDKPALICEAIQSAGLLLLKQLETEYAYIIVSVK